MQPESTWVTLRDLTLAIPISISLVRGHRLWPVSTGRTQALAVLRVLASVDDVAAVTAGAAPGGHLRGRGERDGS